MENGGWSQSLSICPRRGRKQFFVFSAVPIRIFIRDSNDNFPEFDEQYYEFGVLENSGVGTVLGKVHATDRDSENYGSDGIRYTHLGGSISHLYVDYHNVVGAIRSGFTISHFLFHCLDSTWIH